MVYVTPDILIMQNLTLVINLSEIRDFSQIFYIPDERGHRTTKPMVSYHH